MLKKVVLVMLTALLVFVVPVSAQEDVMELDEVVVTASRYQESIMETSVSIEVIDQEEIEESGANNLADLLKLAGSVHIKDNGALMSQKDVVIRGLKETRILILIDGLAISSPHDGSSTLESIPVELIERIEILKSAGSAIYGPNAMGGVINVITKTGEDVDKTKINLSIGSYNTKKISLSHSFKNKKSSTILIYDNLYAEGNIPESMIDRDDLFIKTKLSLSEKTDLSYSLKLNETEIDYPGSTIGGSGSKEEKDMQINISAHQKLEDKDRKLKFNILDRDSLFINYNSLTETNRISLNYSEQIFFSKNDLIYGFDIKRENSKYSSYNETNINNALFFENKYSINNKNNVSLGLRFDDHEEYGSELSPRIGYLYKFNNNLNINLNYNESYRAPTFFELYSPVDYGGNPDLDPEKTKSYEMSFKYQKDNCNRQFSLFKRNGENYIATKPFAGLLYGKYMNFDSVTINGAEFITNRTINENWSFGFNYTYLDAKNDTNDSDLIDIPDNQANLKITYQKDDLKYVLSNTFVGERESVNKVYGQPSVEKDSYFISNLRISNNLTENKELSVEINNLFDKDYQVVDGYQMPGRNFMVNLSTKF
jgi:outer membrane receptor for ferrienterochelin and colicins